VILENAVCNAAPALSALANRREGRGYAVEKGRGVSMIDAGITDGLEVQKMALQTAVQTAALALTTAAFVH
jgi:chaperonin GroEL (HSP60 family)